jgi:hypothetical protein
MHPFSKSAGQEKAQFLAFLNMHKATPFCKQSAAKDHGNIKLNIKAIDPNAAMSGQRHRHRRRYGRSHSHSASGFPTEAMLDRGGQHHHGQCQRHLNFSHLCRRRHFQQDLRIRGNMPKRKTSLSKLNRPMSRARFQFRAQILRSFEEGGHPWKT